MKKFIITVNGQNYEVDVQEVGGAATTARSVAAAPVAPVVSAPTVAPAPVAVPKPVTAAGANEINAPMPGKVLAVKVKVGDGVQRGTVLLILDAMKMQNEILASTDGTVADVYVTAGENVAAGQTMIVLK